MAHGIVSLLCAFSIPLSLAYGVESQAQIYSRDKGILSWENRNQPIAEKFTLSNPSPQAMQLVDFSVSCGCVKILNAPTTIAANGSVEVSISLDPSGYRGRVSQRAFLRYLGTTKQNFELVISCVVPGVWFLEEKVFFSDLNMTDPSFRDIHLIIVGMNRTDVTSFKSDNPAFSITQTLDNQADDDQQKLNKQWYVERTVRIEWLPSSLKGRKFDHGQPHHAEVSANLVHNGEQLVASADLIFQIDGPYQLIPRAAFLGTLGPHLLGDATITIRSTSILKLDPAVITLIIDHPEQVTATLLRSITGEFQCKVTCQAMPNKSAGVLVGNIEGKNQQGEQLFVIPYAVYITENR